MSHLSTRWKRIFLLTHLVCALSTAGFWLAHGVVYMAVLPVYALSSGAVIGGWYLLMALWFGCGAAAVPAGRRQASP